MLRLRTVIPSAVVCTAAPQVDQILPRYQLLFESDNTDEHTIQRSLKELISRLRHLCRKIQSNGLALVFRENKKKKVEIEVFTCYVLDCKDHSPFTCVETQTLIFLALAP